MKEIKKRLPEPYETFAKRAEESMAQQRLQIRIGGQTELRFNPVPKKEEKK